ncbi:hypothetical protein D9613_005542 [Agrocybe pediades]|uniref:Uncharacterized protein n=1 Tax=Agrocybe pediades TaxID=84607 RepID=A0A8H4QX18_9AGAR|nr:hypothetical protein D9613_005542 [Agrocybe pediades]
MGSDNLTSRPALAPCTNIHHTPPAKPTSYLPTPPTENKGKRRHVAENPKIPIKRMKLGVADSSSENESESEEESEEDIAMEDLRVTQNRARNATAFRMHSNLFMRPALGCRKLMPSTLPILQTFVSSNKADVFRCESIGGDTYLTPPYACNYSNSSKQGRSSKLAVGTEQGTVHILNTAKRNDWDCEPPRTTLQPHNNGIFDVKWSADDKTIATCSGDQSTRILDVETGATTHVLRGHTSTVKCVSWDSNNASLLATGGRDGAICLWDLRLAEKLQDDEIGYANPAIVIHGAHEDTTIKSKPKPRKGKQNPVPRSITNILYPDTLPFSLISSSSHDGVLRSWDLRRPTQKRKTKKLPVPTELDASLIDPTSQQGSRRPRGIISLASGVGPSAGLIFAFGADSKIHTFDLPTLSPHRNSFSHPNLQTNSFYVGLSVSPCGRWLACGGSPTMGNCFLFDIENASRPEWSLPPAVELKGQLGEVGAVDWAHDVLATCTDDGTVRTWRSDPQIYSRCQAQPEESRWDWKWSC